MTASKWPWRSNLTLNLKLAALITQVFKCILPLNSRLGGLRGHCDLQTASEVKSGLGIELSDLENLCFHVSLASNCHYSLDLTRRRRRRPNMTHWLHVFERSKNLKDLMLVFRIKGLVWTLLCTIENDIQSWPKKFVLGCVIPPSIAVARSRTLGQTFLANSVQGASAGYQLCFEELKVCLSVCDSGHKWFYKT